MQEVINIQWFAILLIGIAANIDNLGISFSYGLKSNRIPFSANLLIAGISVICAFISISMGSLLSNYFSQSIANFAGGFLIICLGVKFMVTNPISVSSDSNPIALFKVPNPSKIDKAKAITYKETFFLGFILAINCLTIGFGAGITGLPPFFTSISIGIFSLISIFLGVMIGEKVGKTLFGKYSNSIAGFLLIMIGLYEIFF